jgi:hypothetical protein
LFREIYEVSRKAYRGTRAGARCLLGSSGAVTPFAALYCGPAVGEDSRLSRSQFCEIFDPSITQRGVEL